jgi:hypothetical protein
MLIKSQGLHEAIWGLYVRFGLGTSNLAASESELQPAAMIPVLEIGIQKFDKESNIVLDAAKINPKPQLPSP